MFKIQTLYKYYSNINVYVLYSTVTLNPTTSIQIDLKSMCCVILILIKIPTVVPSALLFLKNTVQYCILNTTILNTILLYKTKLVK